MIGYFVVGAMLDMMVETVVVINKVLKRYYAGFILVLIIPAGTLILVWTEELHVIRTLASASPIPNDPK
jgi:hypothetical protein